MVKLYCWSLVDAERAGAAVWQWHGYLQRYPCVLMCMFQAENPARQIDVHMYRTMYPLCSERQTLLLVVHISFFLFIYFFC